MSGFTARTGRLVGIGRVVLFLLLVQVVGWAGQMVGQTGPNLSGSSAVTASVLAAAPGDAAALKLNTKLPACANAPAPVAMPADFPSTFPLPPGSVITGAEKRAGGTVLTALMPATAHDAAVYWNGALRTAGFKQGRGESELHDAEAQYAGDGYIGRWKATDIAGCDGAATVTIFAGR